MTDFDRILQARLQLDFLLSAKSDKDLKSMLATLPYGLEHTYTTLLLHIAARYPHRLDDARKLLRCLTIASPTLTAANLAELLIMKPGEHFIDFEAVATDPYDILDVIAPFLTMTRSKGPNTIVKLCHFSLDEFLTSSRILQGEAHQFHVDSSDGNAWMAAICLQYLTLDIFGDTRQDTDVHRKSSEADYTFRRYAALNWSRHYKAGSKNVDAETRCGPYLRRLLSNEGDLSWYHNWQKVYHESYPWDESHLYSPICFAISQGMDNIVRELVSHQKDINQRFDDGYTCLAIAAKWDRVDLVRYLISIGADLEITAAKGCTPLHLATEFACYKSVLALLEAGANPHARSSSKSTPFYRACRGGDVRIVRKLKELGCDINAKTHDSWTPIMEAAEQNNEDVLDLLFEWGADLTTGRIKAGLNWDLQTKKNNSIARRTVV